jgi:23S rRNA (cytidine1920-2'-O)/16S rRNA (cytidine1409-2'-O)-methyltransferase
VRDPAVHRRVLEDVLSAAEGVGLGLCGLMPSPLLGPSGNVEFLGWWAAGVAAISTAAVSTAITGCLSELESGDGR